MAPAATASVKTIKRDVPFQWEGMDKKGNRVKGKSLAPDEAALRADLRRQGIAPNRIRKQSQAFKSGGKPNAQDIAGFAPQLADQPHPGKRWTAFKPEAKPNARDIGVSARQLATMLGAGIPLVQAFEI